MAMAYLERNPVRAKMVNTAWNYEWSSARAHLKKKNGRSIIDLEYWEKLIGKMDWAEYLKRKEDEAIMGSIRINTSRGRPLGNDTFISNLEKQLGHRIRPLPPHRPRKEGTKKG